MSDKREVRPIDANALCAILEAKADMALVPEYKHAFLNVQAMVNAIPTIDAVPMDFHKKCMDEEIKKRVLTENTNRQILENYAPVVHAKWIKHYIKIGNFDWKYKCSMCGKFNKQYSPPYCPHCGAMMDGGKDDENA